MLPTIVVFFVTNAQIITERFLLANRMKRAAPVYFVSESLVMCEMVTDLRKTQGRTVSLR